MREWLAWLTEPAIVLPDGIAVIRTFLSYFLERDLEDVRERQRANA
ncbi:hypothetical protein GCM10028796_25670 [Ramlibacter monticola]|uniref:Uncharacterized protein n=1 Tax=Ramlibacter monticola TaxID=1926872 RepID=A0A936Z283_9BURK|nr:hypothetical protein [Ramlibacter monticola]MBL0393623.1 hypothetical protein [Ramlibacter monticola]